MRLINIGFIFLSIALFFISCSNPIPQNTLIKGEFKVIEVKPISNQVNNIIKNGSFNEWLSGVRVPSGFLPPFSQYSYVIKKSKKEAGYEVVQRWVKPDAGVDINNLFRVSIPDLPPNNYTFSVNAMIVKGPKVNIGVWRITEPGKVEPFKDPLLEISGEPNKLIQMEVPINIDNEGTYIFCSYAPEGTPHIIWSDWILTAGATNKP